MADGQVDGIALINGVEFTHSSVRCFVAGLRIFGLTELSWTNNHNVGKNYGAQRKPTSKGYGEVDFTGSISMEQVDVERLRDIAPDGDITKLRRVPIIISYVNDKRLVTHQLRKVDFGTDGANSSQGNTSNGQQFDLNIADVRTR